MSSNVVKFTDTVFKESGKKGILKPDEDGYFTVVVGALNSYNSADEFYTADGVVDLFTTSSQLMRRIKNGALYSEVGHPKKQPGMSHDEYYYRVLSIEETNICGHFSELWLDFDYGKNNPHLNAPNLIAILAKVIPAGPKASALEKSLNNPKQNTAFSIRGLTDNFEVNGKTIRKLTGVVTFDFVNEPGIGIAYKYCSPALESLSTSSELSDVLIHKSVLKEVLERNIATVGMENDRELFRDILQSVTTVQKRSGLKDW